MYGRVLDLQEVYLVLKVGVWCVCGGPLHAEVIVQCTGSQVCSGLRDQLGSPHVGIPLRCVIDGDLDTLVGGRIGGVLVVSGEVDIVGYSSGAVDVVLVGPDLVGPGPSV
jgi:hypothetical protein